MKARPDSQVYDSLIQDGGAFLSAMIFLTFLIPVAHEASEPLQKVVDEMEKIA